MSRKIFGIGLSRTGTTSLSFAMLELGFKTCHVFHKPASLARGEAFFDTPIWADYPILDQRFPGSKFILSWRDPEKWYSSFSKNLVHYLKLLRGPDRKRYSPQDQRCYIQIYGMADRVDKEHLLSCYYHHREQAERYFCDRPQDLLILELDEEKNPWKPLCAFLNQTAPNTPFPYVNPSGVINAWGSIVHPCKIVDDLPPTWLEWTQKNLKDGVPPQEIYRALRKKSFDRQAIYHAMGSYFQKEMIE